MSDGRPAGGATGDWVSLATKNCTLLAIWRIRSGWGPVAGAERPARGPTHCSAILPHPGSGRIIAAPACSCLITAHLHNNQPRPSAVWGWFWVLLSGGIVDAWSCGAIAAVGGADQRETLGSARVWAAHLGMARQLSGTVRCGGLAMAQAPVRGPVPWLGQFCRSPSSSVLSIFPPWASLCLGFSSLLGGELVGCLRAVGSGCGGVAGRRAWAGCSSCRALSG